MPDAIQPERGEIVRFVSLLHPEPGAVYELRAFNREGRTISGYFDSPDRFADACIAIAPRCKAIYITLNRINPSLLARRANRCVELGHKDPTTSDGDVIQRTALLVDIDPVRPSEISSSDEEHETAIQRLREIVVWLKRNKWPDPLVCDSGNGAHAIYRIDLPVQDSGIVANSLKALAARFSDPVISVDTGNFNPSRIVKVAGTPVRKGDATTDRPHRLAHILFPAVEAA